jgi:hypothetical protein
MIVEDIVSTSGERPEKFYKRTAMFDEHCEDTGPHIDVL